MNFSFDVFYDIGGLFHGLVCINKRISKGKKVTVQPIICNPSTGQTLILPKLKTRRFESKSLFGYDPIDKQFKVLSRSRCGRDKVLSEEHQVLTLGTGNLSWRMIECSGTGTLGYYPHNEICINGVLYYQYLNISTKPYIIVCFDVRSEKFIFIKVKETLKSAVLYGTMINYKGKLGLFLPENGTVLDRSSRSLKLWVLEDLERQEWSEHTYMLPASWENIVGYTSFVCVGMTQQNEIVLSWRVSRFTSYLLYFNHERDTIVRVYIQGIDASKYDVVRIYLDHVEDVKLM